MPQRGRRGRPRPQVIHENLEIESGMITTVHNITGTQPMVDMPNVKKKDLRPRWLKT
jgi:glyceraldehyde 3-phosphate dehydrogenase